MIDLQSFTGNFGGVNGFEFVSLLLNSIGYNESRSIRFLSAGQSFGQNPLQSNDLSFSSTILIINIISGAKLIKFRESKENNTQ